MIDEPARLIENEIRYEITRQVTRDIWRIAAGEASTRKYRRGRDRGTGHNR